MVKDVPSVAAHLYALKREEFIAARNVHAEEARAHGDQSLAESIRNLAKPSAAAWVLNMLARHRREEIARVLALGATLREAQENLDADELRGLSRQRQQLIITVVQRGRALAQELGSRISDSTASEVEQTLQAAMADPDAADAVRKGLLTRALSSSGFEAVDLADSVALRPRQAATVSESSEQEFAEARGAAEEAERRVSELRSKLDVGERRIATLVTRRSELMRESQDLREQLAAVSADIVEVDRQAETLHQEWRKAAADAQDAEREVADASARFDWLSRD